MSAGEHDWLRTRPEDLEFHSNRIMFWVMNGEIRIAPKGTTKSHLEMAESEGWINQGDTEKFFKQNMRGFYLVEGEMDRIHFYRGVGFQFDEETVTLATNMLPNFVSELNLAPTTRVYFGPKDSIINNKEYEIYYAGTVSDILSKQNS